MQHYVNAVLNREREIWAACEQITPTLSLIKMVMPTGQSVAALYIYCSGSSCNDRDA